MGFVGRGRFTAVSLAWLVSAAMTAGPARADEPIGYSVRVPLDHGAPWRGASAIRYELGAPFSADRPTVFVIADAQQFYVRRGAMADLQKKLFGDAFNVVGIMTRGTLDEFTRAARGPDGTPDWRQAWRLFNADQYVGDIEAVRRELEIPEGRLLLYGQSGGGYLVHQYLARYPKAAARAFTRVPVHPFHVGALGLNPDRFWEEIGRTDPALREMLRGVLARRPAERAEILMTLQRQNFFVAPDRLGPARAELIRALAEGREADWRRLREAYQVDSVRSLFESEAGIPIRVRLYEFFEPSGGRSRLGGEAIHPDLENQASFAAPLMALRDAGAIPAPAFDPQAPHRVTAEVFVLAGRWDHTVDYRSLIALASSYPRHALFLADDDHQSHRMQETGADTLLLRAFLGHGLGSEPLRAALAQAEPHRWKEP